MSTSGKVFLRPRDRVRVVFHDGAVEFDTRVKGDWKPRHLWVPVMWFIIGLISRELKAAWYASYSIALGRTVYNPSSIVRLDALLHEARNVFHYERWSLFALNPSTRLLQGRLDSFTVPWNWLLSTVKCGSDARTETFALIIPPVDIHTELEIF